MLKRARTKRDTGITLEWQEAGRVTMQKRRETLSLSLSLFASPLLFLALAIERSRLLPCTCCRTRLRSKFDRHPAGPGKKETIRNKKVEGTLVTLNVPRSSRLKFVAFGPMNVPFCVRPSRRVKCKVILDSETTPLDSLHRDHPRTSNFNALQPHNSTLPFCRPQFSRLIYTIESQPIKC